MPHNLDLILTIAGGLSAALLAGYITHRLGLSPIVGYLLGGMVVGPHTPGFVADTSLAEQLAEIGVILLMFGVGLQFHVEELLRVRRVAIPGAVAQSAVATIMGGVVVRAFGWDWTAGIVFGLALSVASTVVLIRVLADNRALHTTAGHIAVGWLVVEDLFTVGALVLLPALVGGEAGASVPVTLAIAAVKVAALVGFTMIVGRRAIPWILDRMVATRSRELFTLTVLVIALGIAVGSALVFGVSMALGAFLAGLVVGRSEYSLRAASEALPMRDAFSVLFFVSVGMLLEPGYVLRAPGLILSALAVVLIAKPATALVIVRALGYPASVSLPVAVALAQIGEFSFILASLGRELGILGPESTQVLVAVAIASIVVNPLLYRGTGGVERWIGRTGWASALMNPRPPVEGDARGHGTPAADPDHRAVVLGSGPTGRTVIRLLRENGVEPIVVEMNVETVRQLRDERVQAIYGDATRRDTLDAADLAHAGALILTSAGMTGASETIRLAREINPKVRILARTSYLRDLPELIRAGADEVFAAEAEVALSMTEALLSRLGATPEQIDRERVRIREELAQPER